VKRVWLSLLPILLILFLMGCRGAPRERLIIFHAGSLAVPLDEIDQGFRRIHPEVKVQREAAGSRTAIRKLTELGKPADLIASADRLAIEELMFPRFASWYISFATNQMVIAYTERSKFGDEIASGNWYEILLRQGVSYGHSDPDQDPAGYRTLMVWQLAERFYQVPGLYQRLEESRPEANIRPKETDLVPLLQAGELDYAFEYRSIARQHGLKFVELPPEINLSAIEHRDFYAQARVEVSGKKPGETVTYTATPIVYAITIPENAPHPELAIAYIQFLLGEEGRAIMKRNGQPPITPALASDPARLPSELREGVR
jgi:molybdate/tungstate transport system substrate-binding protein